MPALFSLRFILLALVLFSFDPVGFGAAEPSKVPERKPSPVHTPKLVAAPTDQPGYREKLTASVERYIKLYYSANLKGARDEALASLALATEAGNAADEAQFVKALGYVSWLLGDSASAIAYEQRLLNYADKTNDDALRSIAYRVLGTVSGQMGDRKKNHDYTQLAFDFAEKAHDDDLRAGALNNLGTIAMADGDYEKSRRMHEQVLAYREKAGDPWDIAGSLTNLGDVAIAEKDFPHALDFHQRGLALRMLVNDRRGQARSLRQIGGVLRQMGRTDEALARLSDALALGEKITGHELLGDIWQEIALTREARHDYAEALAAERKAALERQALAGERTRDRIAELEARFDLAKKQQTIDTLSKEQQLQATKLRLQASELNQSRLQRYALVAVVVLGVLCVIAILSRQRLKLAAERKARATAEEADRLKTRLLAIASHDLRNPLGNLYLLAENLREEQPAGAPGDPRLASISIEAQRLLHLVEDLIETAALEVGRLELRKENVDLAEITLAVLGEYQWQATAKHQQLNFAPPPVGTGNVKADGRRLHQVISNLVGNAIKFTPEHKKISLALGRSATEVFLAITDEGPGLTEEDQIRAFAPFTKLSAQPSGGESSHGLGLSIAQEIIRLHGGSITVDSTSGQGATFTLHLPL